MIIGLFFGSMKMMKRLVLSFLGLLLSCSFYAQTAVGETVCFIDGKAVSVDEYRDYCAWMGTSEEMNVEKMQHFIQLKVKSAEGAQLGYDSLPEFKQRLSVVNKAMNLMNRTDSEQVDAQCKARLDRLNAQHREKGWAKYEMLTIPLLQSQTYRDEQVACALLQTWALQQQDTVSLDMATSQTKAIYVCEKEWVAVDHLIKEMAQAIAQTPEGKLSEVFCTPIGAHVVRVVSKTNEIGMDDVRWLSDYRRKQVARCYSRLTDCQIAKDVLLAEYWEDAHLLRWGDSRIDEPQLKKYFEQHKRKYKWELPRYKGAIFYCQSKKDAKRIKRAIKRKDLGEYRKEVKSLVAAGRIGDTQVDAGLFVIGRNDAVDGMVFKCGQWSPQPNYPYVFEKGKILDETPESYEDVKEAVYQDCLDEWNATLYQELENKYDIKKNCREDDARK